MEEWKTDGNKQLEVMEGGGEGGDSRRNRRLIGSRDSVMTCYCSLITAGVMWSKVYFCFCSGAVKGRGI